MGSRFDTVNGDPIVILPYAQAFQPYSEVLNFKVPKDSSIGGQTADINFVRLDSLLNLPAGFTLQCNTSNCEFLGDSFGCAVMSGTPFVPDSIELRVAIAYNIDLGGGSATVRDTLGGYYFVTQGNIGLKEQSGLNPTPRVFPNPAADKVFLNFDNQKSYSAKLTVTSIIGTTILEKAVNLTNGSNRLEINTRNFAPGVYVYSLRGGETNFSGRFTISR